MNCDQPTPTYPSDVTEVESEVVTNGPRQPLAAIDIGTNSIHLLLARPLEGSRFEILTREKEMVRLGSGSGDMKVLSPDAIDRGVACLERYRRIAEPYDASIRAVATSAV